MSDVKVEYGTNGATLVHIVLPGWDEEHRNVFVRKGVSYRDEDDRLVFRYKTAAISAPHNFLCTDIALARVLQAALVDACRHADGLDRQYPVGAISNKSVKPTGRRHLATPWSNSGAGTGQDPDSFNLARSSWPDGGVTVSFSLPDLVGLRVWADKGTVEGAGKALHYRPACIGVDDGYDGDRNLSFWRGFAHLLDGAVRQAELLDREFITGAAVGSSVPSP